MPSDSRLAAWASMSFTLSCSWIAAGLMDAALQYSPCCVFQSTHVNAQTYEQRFLIPSCFVVNSQKLGQEVDDCKLYEAPHSMRVCTEIYWGRFDPFLFQLLWKNRLGWCSTYCWIWCGKCLNIEPETAVLPNWRPKWEKEWQTSLHAKRNASLVLVPQHEDFL